MKKIILILPILISLFSCSRENIKFYTVRENFQLDIEKIPNYNWSEFNEEFKLDYCAHQVRQSMVKLLKYKKFKFNNFENYIQKDQNKFSSFYIARAYCQVLNSRKEKLNNQNINYVLATIVAIGMREGGFQTYNKDNKSCSSGLQQVQDISCWPNEPTRRAIEYFGSKQAAIRPTKYELINNVKLNIDWSIFILKCSNWKPINYNGNTDMTKDGKEQIKVGYDRDVKEYIKLIYPLLKDAL